MNEHDKTRVAELEAAQARSDRNAAENQRDAVANIAVNEAVNRAVAENQTSEAKMRTAEAESRERTMATSASMARQDATYERAAASNATFSATLVGVVAVALVLAVIGYFAWWQPNHAVDASTNTFIRTDKTTEKAAAPSTVIVNPPDVNVKVNVPPAEPKSEDKPAPTDTPPATESDPTPAQSGGGEASKAPDSSSGGEKP